MRISCLRALLPALCLAAPHLSAQERAGLETLLRDRIARDTAVVAVLYRDPARRETVSIAPGTRFHAASTMKVPVLIELARQVDAGELHWDDSLTVRNQFKSIVDGSPYRLDPRDDSDSTLYRLEGQAVSLNRLARLMITRSSNLATNLIIERVGPTRVNRTAHRLGADSITVLRGVEDGKAFERGLNNTTTALDLGALLEAVAAGRAASPSATDTIRQMLLAQEFNDGIPAGLPPGTPVAHKTGEITAIAHDAAIVYPAGRGPYILVVLTRGYAERKDAARLMADLSGIVYRWASDKTGPRQ